MTTQGDDQAPWDQGTLEFAGLSRVRLDALLQELLGRVDEMLDSQDRLRRLLDAVVVIGSDLDLYSALDRIVLAACELSGARYGALGVLRPDGERLASFITQGASPDEIAAIGPFPEGHGILGLLIDDPRPLRLQDIAEHPRSFGFPANHPPMKSFLGVPVRVRDQVFGNLYLTEKRDGADFTADDEHVVMALAVAAGVVIDNARLYADTESRRQWLEAAAEITQFLLGEFDGRLALQLIARRAKEVSHGQVAAVLLNDGDELVFEALDGPGTDGFRNVRLPTSHPLVRDILDQRHSVVLESLPRMAKEHGIVVTPAIEELGRTMIVPMPKGDRSSGGVLVVAAHRDALLAGADESTELIASFASQATLALDRAEAQKDRAQLAVLEDRDRIARDLHDVVIQRLFATGLQLQGMQPLVRPEGRDRLGGAVEDIDATIRDLRSAIFGLQQQQSDARHLLRADIGAVVAEYTETMGFTPNLTVKGPLDSVVSVKVRPQILAAIREGLSNVVRHAAASSVEVEVSISGDDVVARILDNGIGFQDTGRSSGLRNLRERAESLGGAVRVEAVHPHGTLLELRAPYTGEPS